MWTGCLQPEFADAAAMKEAPPSDPRPFIDEVEKLRSPMADCDFASSFGAIVVMPQGWLPRALAMRGPRHAGTGAPRRGWSSKLGTPTAS